MVRILSADEPGAAEAAAARLARGELVALPTETVYGLAADAADGRAVAAIYAAKARPRFNPLIAHVASIEMATQHVVFDAAVRNLAEHFWPGPLTMVLPASSASDIHVLARAGLPTIAVRMPRGIARDVIEGLGRPVVAPSANPSGKVSPTSAAHVARMLGGRVDLVLDGGPSSVGVESTIVRLEADRIVLLRPGGLSREAIEAASGLPVISAAADAPIEAPGQMLSHYAPHGLVRLDATDVRPSEWLVRFGGGPVAGEGEAAGVSQLSLAGDIAEAAANLFAVLAELDAARVERIAVMPIPREGIGEAVNDRLARAAAPRDIVEG
ncbi:L-threonylcarbamoyladenylate synthase [Aureimonas leprariae]|uniref:Threonylcarbamoyl-AMP synthase n=1 Tax=Plantimonas leprariae TaxID=2615207 RepID=A0A7V7PQE4_9HYPH|nr:L-threonylcarbamoyladenylate synthase [Aureimonas leprariae]KAB0680277.1 threonylcarbamoyl-AMP synthase [Aureimonas leprariae]